MRAAPALLIASIFVCLSSIAAQPKTPLLAIAPLGQVPRTDITEIRRAIETTYGWSTVELAPQPLPKSAWYQPRRRHRAEKILQWLRGRKPLAADKIMAITAKDISTTKGRYPDWGICGLAEMPGSTSVISTYRIKKKLRAPNRKRRHEKYLQRLRDLAVHEFGHQLGLEHCPHRGCVMEDAKGTVGTFDHSTNELCADCRHQLDR